MIPMKDNDKQFKIRQLEKQLKEAAMLARANPHIAAYQRKLANIQTKLMQLKSL